MPAASVRTWIAALQGSQQRLGALASSLSPEQLRGPSYDTDWTVAQVLSHIGSQAEIAEQSLAAVLDGAEPPSDFTKIWAVWDARDPDEQAAQFLIHDAAQVAYLERLSDEQLDGIHAKLFGQEFDAIGMVWLRLGEHALHSWDVAVTLDQDATLAPESVALLIDRVPFIAQWAGKPPGGTFRVLIQATGPDREFLLDVGESVSLTAQSTAQSDPPAADEVQARIQMPAETLLRLVYGRLDPDHTPPVKAVSGDVSLEQLREVFPGF